MAGRSRLEPSPDRMCGSKRFCFMHLARFAVFFSTAWAWFKGVFGKLAASSPRGILFVIRKRSRRGDEFDVLFSTHDAETAARLLQGSPAPLLKQLPAAVGGDCPAPPHAAASPEPLLPLVPPQLTAPQLLDAHQPQSSLTKSATPTKKRRPRSRARRDLASSRSMGGYRSTPRRKKG
jgi:hypothetical protein